MLYRALQSTNKSFGMVMQDLSLPYPSAQEFIEYTAAEFNIWPLWLCPLREISSPSFHPSTTLPGPGSDPKPMLNIGLWGRGSQDFDAFVTQNKHLEQKLSELGGRKMLYSHAYYWEEEFWALYDKQWYLDLRSTYGATSLPSVYDKIRIDLGKIAAPGRGGWWDMFWSMWPVAGIVGIRSAIRSGDYLLHRNLGWRR